MQYQGKPLFYGQFQVKGKELLLPGRGFPVGLIILIKAGLPNRVKSAFSGQGFQQGQGFPGGKTGGAVAGPEPFLNLGRGQLGMYPKTAKHPGDSPLPGQVFVAGKGLPVPGAGGADYTEPPPFFFRAGKRAKELPGVAMGIGEHILIFIRLPDRTTSPGGKKQKLFVKRRANAGPC
jgi:hypothetical protein